MIYVGECKNGALHGQGIRYIYSDFYRSIYYAEGTYVDGKFTDGCITNRFGLYMVINGNPNREPSPPIITQTDLRHTYSILKGALPKFPGEPLNEEQKEFLKKKK